MVEAWTLWDWKKSQSIEGSGLIWKKQYRSEVTLRWYDCEARRSAVMKTIEYAKSYGPGDVVRVYDWGRPSFSSVSPGSVGEAILHHLCSE